MSEACLNAFVAFLWASVFVMLIYAIRDNDGCDQPAWVGRVANWGITPLFMFTVVFTVWRVSL